MKQITNQRARKVLYYARGFSQQFLVPNAFYRSQLERKLARLGEYDRSEVERRVNYYNRLDADFQVSGDAALLKDIPFSSKTVYYYDLREILRHFPARAAVDYLFGDIYWIAERPSLVKSRPISEDNANSVVINMEKLRHFRPIRDELPYDEKIDKLVWRGAGWQEHRKEFLRRCCGHPLCDVGQVNTPEEGTPPEWNKPKMTVPEQLRYKFILSIEGNDVATNLKWISQSNSLCFMTKPKIESWFMEGCLVASKHYVEVRDDYADLGEKVEYYVRNPDEAKAIIKNSQDYYRSFCDPRLEELVSLLVVKKYLEKAGQY
ncbi:hypothetical protein PDESU_04182 [Pontiella desulfatans]|uniref:Glycosyl transferase CAP10 domain-containing protein n=1 Tax=Pontiella desulfatans TaxID=2750659 RepID=A0A6C2U727_PONDE|nr:glycosyl transferase family 90 [Pontiella desulfatans]VGO15597.1 hypothetical protein PDESU_04182 [Pontiella desulfatans]